MIILHLLQPHLPGPLGSVLKDAAGTGMDQRRGPVQDRAMFSLELDGQNFASAGLIELRVPLFPLLPQPPGETPFRYSVLQHRWANWVR